MRTVLALGLLVPMVIGGFACSPAEEEPAVEPPPEAEPEAPPADVSGLRPPQISKMGPQPPGPEPQAVPRVPEPVFKTPKTAENPTLADARAQSQFNAMDRKSPISNGVFEAWEEPGPVHWNGNFTYKNPGDPPDPDIGMVANVVEGNWALRLMPKGTYLELWQDVTLPEDMEDAPVLDISAYVRNPVVEGFAIRLTYATPDAQHVAEVYPEQAGPEWTRYHARVELPEDVGNKSVRLYLTRDASVKKRIVIDAVSVLVLNPAKAETPPEA